MSVKTGDMYSGMTSGSFGTNKAVKKQREEFKEKKEELQIALTPSYERLIEDLDAEIKANTDITNFMTGGYVSDDEVRFELAARRRYVEKLESLKKKYTSTVKGVRNEE